MVDEPCEENGGDSLLTGAPALNSRATRSFSCQEQPLDKDGVFRFLLALATPQKAAKRTCCQYAPEEWRDGEITRKEQCLIYWPLLFAMALCSPRDLFSAYELVVLTKDGGTFTGGSSYGGNDEHGNYSRTHCH